MIIQLITRWLPNLHSMRTWTIRIVGEGGSSDIHEGGWTQGLRRNKLTKRLIYIIDCRARTSFGGRSPGEFYSVDAKRNRGNTSSLGARWRRLRAITTEIATEDYDGRFLPMTKVEDHGEWSQRFQRLPRVHEDSETIGTVANWIWTDDRMVVITQATGKRSHCTNGKYFKGILQENTRRYRLYL